MSKATEGYRRCRLCGETKPLTAFHRDKSRKNGHRGTCAACREALSQFGRAPEELPWRYASVTITELDAMLPGGLEVCSTRIKGSVVYHLLR